MIEPNLRSESHYVHIRGKAFIIFKAIAPWKSLIYLHSLDWWHTKRFIFFSMIYCTRSAHSHHLFSTTSHVPSGHSLIVIRTSRKLCTKLSRPISCVVEPAMSMIQSVLAMGYQKSGLIRWGRRGLYMYIVPNGEKIP